MDDTETQRLFEGEALLRRMYKYGLLEEGQNKLDYVLALSPQDFLERRLQTLVFKLGLAKSIHHARVLIRQRHIRCAAVAVPQRPLRSRLKYAFTNAAAPLTQLSNRVAKAAALSTLSLPARQLCMARSQQSCLQHASSRLKFNFCCHYPMYKLQYQV